MQNVYHLDNDGFAVANFQQECGCNAEGPGETCREGKCLWKLCEKKSLLFFTEKITFQEMDVTIGKWQKHLGA